MGKYDFRDLCILKQRVERAFKVSATGEYDAKEEYICLAEKNMIDELIDMAVSLESGFSELREAYRKLFRLRDNYSLHGEHTEYEKLAFSTTGTVMHVLGYIIRILDEAFGGEENGLVDYTEDNGYCETGMMKNGDV